MTNEHTFRSPDNVYLIGAGRWARVILQVLCKHLPRSTEVVVVSAHHADIIQKLIDKRVGNPHISVRDAFPENANQNGAVIVANAARDHESAVREALAHNLPILVEKPLSLTADSTKALIDLAKKKNVYLAAAHVFLFAEYLSRFAKVVKAVPSPSSIRLQWTDPRAEKRYGEKKAFDSSLPIILDVFPHILTILRATMPGQSISFTDLALDRGGATVALQLSIGDILCGVQLARNDSQRTRLLELTTSHSQLRLDFSTEPGTITNGTESYPGDPSWTSRLGPLALQLESFLAGAVHGNWDERLAPDTAYEANLLMDKMMINYRSDQQAWLQLQTASDACPSEEDVDYALVEASQFRRT